MRRLAITVLGAVLILAGLVGLADSAASAGGGDGDGRPGRVDVLEVAGYLDPVLVDFVGRSVSEAEDDGAIAVVLQLNSPGSVVSDGALTDLARRVDEATIPVAVWIGPSGSRALGGAAELAAVAAELGMAPRSQLGQVGDQRLPSEPGGFGELFDGRLASSSVDGEQAVEAGHADRLAPTLGSFVNDLEGFETELVDRDGGAQREPVTETRFRKLPVSAQLFHTAASPAVAYLLLVLGMGLIVFELYTAGIGIAAAVGAVCVVLGSYGLATLPARGWAVGLLVLSMVAFAVDVQTGVPRFWTGVGFVAFTLGTIFLFDGPGLSWITLLASFAGVAVAVLAGMPAMVRTRFSTPTIGREWMIGEQGQVVGDVAPDGTVRVRDALWRARSNRATPLETGEEVVVAGIDGLVLEVESVDEDRRPRQHRS